jgi:sugar lactone lactonase YvrE
VEKVFDDVTLSNGVGWSPDDRRMYYVDTATRRMDVFDYDADSGAIRNRRPLVHFAQGLPDGLTVDEEGAIWVVVNGTGEVHRYSPDGRLDRTLRLPVLLGTSCSFGGDDLRDLYITTMTEGMSSEQRREQPLAGALFRCRPGVRGLPPSSYKG